MRSKLKWLISLLVTLGLLWAVFHPVNLSQVFSYWQKARLIYLLAALMVSFLTNCWLATGKWKLILTRLGLPLPFREAFLIKMGSAAIKSVAPLRSGEATRVVYLKRKYNFSVVKATSSIMLELLANIIAFALIIAGGGLILGFKRLPIGLIFILLVLLAALLSSGRLKEGVNTLIGKIPFPRIRGGLQTLLTLYRYFSPGQIGLILFYSLIIQGGKLLTFYLINLSFDLTLPPAAYFIFLPLSILLGTIPITILGLGLREGSLTALLHDFCRTPKAAVLGSALLFSLVEYIFPALLGLFWTGKFTARLMEKKQMQDSGYKMQDSGYKMQDAGYKM